MKIDPAERSPQFPPQAVDNAKKKQAPGGFQAVLQQTIQKTGPSKACMASTVRSMTGPQAPMAASSGRENAGEALAHKLLDRLEDYQKMLGDPDMTLKRMQPAVEEMENQAVGTREILAGLPEGHPLRSILQDTIASIDQEIARFNAGDYVDD
jgi:hypothetical protein